MAFLNGYKKIYRERHHFYVDQSERMRIGLDKLDEAEINCDALSKELVVKEKHLTIANKKADEVINIID